MSDNVLGLVVLCVIGLMVLAAVLGARRRPPESVITTGTVRGLRGLAVHSWRGHWSQAAVGWLLLALLLAWGVSSSRSHPVGGGLLVVVGLVVGYVGWCRATGRAGDGTITMTPAGIHQRSAGSDVFIEWDDVRGMETTPTDLVVRTSRPAVPTQHMLPLVGGRRRAVAADLVSLPCRDLPPLPYPAMVELYATSPAARDELATDEAVHRARALLAPQPSAPASWAGPRRARATRGDGGPDQPVGRAELVLDVVCVLVLGWVLWVTAAAQAQQAAAASGDGRPGVMRVEGLRPARGEDIPVGTFTDRDGTVTPQVAWQDRPATVGDSLAGVRVGDRAWAPGVRMGAWDVVVAATVLGLLGWRILVLVRHWNGRRRRGW